MKKWNWKKIITAAVVGMFLLTGCGAETPEKNEPEAEATPLKVGVLRIADSFPFYVAQKEGLFEKHNVNVEVNEFSSGRDQSTALQGGEVDVLMTDPVVAGLSIKGGADIRIVGMALGAVPEEGRFLVVSAPDSNITSPEQLEGKTVAISNNTMMDYLVEQYADTLDLDFDKINKVNMPDLMLRTTTLLEGKEIDAAILPDPLAAYAVAEGANIVIDDTKLGENISQSVVAVSKKAIDEQNDQVAKFMAAYNEAIEMINADPDAYKEYALECAKVPKEVAESYSTPTFTANVVPAESDIARVNEWLVKRGLIEEPFKYEDMVDVQFIK